MSSPFKVGDKVVRINEDHGNFKVGDVGLVTCAAAAGRSDVQLLADLPGYTHQSKNLRAAIAGVDYHPYITVEAPEANSGHLADGSSVQKHSAGPIYPCVIRLRDKRLKGLGLFDYGLTSPRNSEPLWFSTLEAAHSVADIINKDIAP